MSVVVGGEGTDVAPVRGLGLRMWLCLWTRTCAAGLGAAAGLWVFPQLELDDLAEGFTVGFCKVLPGGTAGNAGRVQGIRLRDNDAQTTGTGGHGLLLWEERVYASLTDFPPPFKVQHASRTIHFVKPPTHALFSLSLNLVRDSIPNQLRIYRVHRNLRWRDRHCRFSASRGRVQGNSRRLSDTPKRFDFIEFFAKRLGGAERVLQDIGDELRVFDE